MRILNFETVKDPPHRKLAYTFLHSNRKIIIFYFLFFIALSRLVLKYFKKFTQ